MKWLAWVLVLAHVGLGLFEMHVLILALQALLLIAFVLQQKSLLPPLKNWIVQILAISAGVFSYFHYGTFVGVEPGLTLLSTMACLRLFNLNRKVHHYSLLSMLLLILALYLIQHDGLFSLFVMIIDVAIIIYYIALLYGQGKIQQQFSLRSMVRLMALGLPLWMAMFFIFPRFSLTFFHFKPLAATVGISDSLNPGDVEKLALSSQLVGRIKLVSSSAVEQIKAEPYWRVNVFDESKGLSWFRSSSFTRVEPEASDRDANPLWEVTLEPHFSKWLMLPDPGAFLSITGGMQNRVYYQGENVLQFAEPLFGRVRYLSQRIPEPTIEKGFKRYLTKPQNVSPNVQYWVNQLIANERDEARIVQKFIAYFVSQGFEYTLQPGVLVGDQLEDFLFKKKKGFCEHYAGALATLLRLVDVPSRVVVGFHGGLFNPQAQTYTIKSRDAHAWVEYFVADKRKWIRIDPVAFIEPLRIQMGSAMFDLTAEQREVARGLSNDFVFANKNFFAMLLAQYERFFDLTNARWNDLLLNYTWERQVLFFQQLIDSVIRKTSSWGLGILLLFTMIFLIRVKLKNYSKTKRDPFLHQFSQLEKVIQKKYSLQRQPTQGEASYLELVAQKNPDLYAEVGSFWKKYAEGRYAQNFALLDQVQQARQKLCRQIMKST